MDAFLRVGALSQEYGIYIPGTTACMVVIFMLGTCRVDGPRASSTIDPLYYSIVFGSLILVDMLVGLQCSFALH